MKNKLFPLAFLCFLFFQGNAQSLNEVTKIVASDRGADDNFGCAVAFSDYLIVGALFEDEDANGANNLAAAGSAYIYERTGFSGAWTQTQKIVASDRAFTDRFGEVVATYGNYAMVSALNEDHDENGGNNMLNAGSVYVYERGSNGTWTEVQKIVNSDRAVNDKFGQSISMYGDFAVISTTQEDEDANGGATLARAGSAYIFERNSSGTWVEVQKIVAGDRASGDEFGQSVSIFGDYILVGTSYDDKDENGGNIENDAGSAYLFKRDANGTWNQIQKFVAADRGEFDRFGYSVAVNNDFAMIGSHMDDEDENGGNTINNSGSVYMFKNNGDGTWSQSQKLVASTREDDERIGFSVTMSGNLAIAGSQWGDHDQSGGNMLTNAGSSYIYELDANGVWNETIKMTASDRDENDLFGTTVAVNGNEIVVGAYLEDEDDNGGNTVSGAGSAYIFEYSNTPVSINEPTFLPEFKVFPNPTTEQISIDLGETVQEVRVFVNSVDGRMVSEEQFTQEQILSLNIAGIPGVYLVRVVTPDGKMKTVRVVKQ